MSWDRLNALYGPVKEFAVKALRQIEASAENGIWGAHWGCAVIAGALLVDEQLVDEDARASVKVLLEGILRTQPGFQGDGTGASASLSRGQFADRILAELKPHAQEPKEIGHDVIYVAYVLRALDHFEITPWASLADRVAALIRKVKASGPGWITVNGKNEVRELNAEEAKTGANCWTLFSEFDRPRQMEIGDMQLGHLLTHGHAIEMLRHRADGFPISDFETAYRKRLYGLRLANDDQRDNSPLRLRKLDPRTKGYWMLVESLGDMHGHAFKYAYSFLDLRRGGVSEADVERFGRILWPDEPKP